MLEISYNNHRLQDFEDELIESDLLDELEARFPTLGRRIRKIYNGLFPIQYLMFQLMKGDFQDAINLEAHIIGYSPTGSGKTMAYLMPIVDLALSKLERKDDRSKPFAMIFTISRIAALSVENKLEQLLSGTDIKIGFIDEMKNLSNRFDIGIIYDCRSAYKGINSNFYSDLKYLVIDEADTIFIQTDNYYFCEKLREVSKCRCLLFSATPNRYLKEFVKETDYFKISTGIWIPNTVQCQLVYVNCQKTPTIVRIANETPEFFTNTRLVTQETWEAVSSNEKLHPFDQLYKTLQEIQQNKKNKILIFIKKTSFAKILAAKLVFLGFKASAAVNVKTEESIQLFRQGKCDILIGTWKLCRGLDEEIDVVINYDLPIEFNDFLSRCGRTGRAGQIGQVYTFVDPDNHNDYDQNVLRQIEENFGKN